MQPETYCYSKKFKERKENCSAYKEKGKETAIMQDVTRNHFGFTKRFNLLTQTGN